jgi:hypothetical protein
MAVHGYGGLLRWALSIVAGKVLHATTTPLLLVPTGEDFFPWSGWFFSLTAGESR